MLFCVVLLVLFVEIFAKKNGFKLIENAKLELREDVYYVSTAPKEQRHRVIFAVKQKNMDKLTRTLYDVSDPNSANYGRHWTKQQVGEFTTNPEAYEAVIAYLQGIPGTEIIKVTPFKEYITVDAPVHAWEDMFQTKFHFYKLSKSFHERDPENDKVIIRTTEYSLPRELTAHVFAVFNIVQFPVHFGRMNIEKKADYEVSPDKVVFTDSGIQKGYVSPKLISEYYNISSNTGNSNVSQAVYETGSEGMSPADLSYFQKYFKLPNQTINNDINGHVSNSACTTYSDCGER